MQRIEDIIDDIYSRHVAAGLLTYEDAQALIELAGQTGRYSFTKGALRQAMRQRIEQRYD